MLYFRWYPTYNQLLGCSQKEEKKFNMALFLISRVYDEGFSERSFRVVKASSRVAVTRHILAHYDMWEYFITSSIFCLWLDDPNVGPKELWEGMNRVIINAEDRQKLMNVFIPWVCQLSPETFLKWVDRTYVDGSSQAQLTIYEIHDIEVCDEATA
jgi:hypothetical protein